MFQVGDLIVYGTTGVCRVEKIGKPDFSGAADGVDYYTLAPFYSASSKIFTPCDNQKIVMRPIMTKKEAEELIEEIDTIGTVVVPDERKREEQYKELMKTGDARKFVSIIKTIHIRKRERLSEGKKITTSDEKYFQLAEDKLYGELAIVLEIDKKEVKGFLSRKVSTVGDDNCFA